MRLTCCLTTALLMLAAAPMHAADPVATALLQAFRAAVDRGDELTAFSLSRRLAIADDPKAQYRLAMLLAQPISSAQPDPDMAAYWYERATELGHAPAARALADLYANGTIGSFRSAGQPAPRVGEAISWYRAAATLGSADADAALSALGAKLPLAEALLERASGSAVAARQKLEALARRGDLEAMYWRGVMEEKGEGGPASPMGAIPWYEKGYQYGFENAALALGKIYEAGLGVPRNIDQAQRMYSAAGAHRSAGDAGVALERLDFERRYRALPPVDVEGALVAISSRLPRLARSILHPLAKGGDPDAQYWLAEVQEGSFGTASHEEAIRWYRRAALQGDTEAAYRLAHLFDDRVDRAGRGLGDAAERARWLRRAAEGGHGAAALALGLAYKERRGVAADQREADRWYKRAHLADEGISRLSRLACVEDGNAPQLIAAYLACNRGDATGLAAALVPLAAAGDASAQAWVAYIMAGGAGTGGGYDLRVRPNMQRAARWYARAAEQSLPSAMFDYGVLLEHGVGVPIDRAAAKLWYEKAAGQGFPAAQDALASFGADEP